MAFDHKTILRQLLPELAAPMAQLPPALWDRLEEIRLRTGQAVLLKFAGFEGYLGPEGPLPPSEQAEAFILTRQMLERMVLLLSKSSFYALEEELRQGFITIPGGHRVGFVGEGVLENHKIKTLKNISSINMRIARPVLGACRVVLPYVIENGQLLQSLIVSPPKVGKTTVLRDLVRVLADGEAGLPPCDVGVADERLEIGAVFEGVPQLPVGSRTDILTGCPKDEAIMLLIRSMSPDVIVTDEIGRLGDSLALMEALNAGIKVVATAHGGSYEELLGRPALAELLRAAYFQRIIVLGREAGKVVVKKVFNAKGKLLPNFG